MKMNGFQELNLNELYQINGGKWSLKKFFKGLLDIVIDDPKPAPKSKGRRTDLDHVGAYEP